MCCCFLPANKNDCFPNVPATHQCVNEASDMSHLLVLFSIVQVNKRVLFGVPDVLQQA